MGGLPRPGEAGSLGLMSTSVPCGIAYCISAKQSCLDHCARKSREHLIQRLYAGSVVIEQQLARSICDGLRPSSNIIDA